MAACFPIDIEWMIFNANPDVFCAQTHITQIQTKITNESITVLPGISKTSDKRNNKNEFYWYKFEITLFGINLKWKKKQIQYWIIFRFSSNDIIFILKCSSFDRKRWDLNKVFFKNICIKERNVTVFLIKWIKF